VPVFQRPHNIGLPPNAAQGVRITTPLSLTSVLSGTSNLGTVVKGDLMLEESDNAINNVQTMYVDASQMALPVRLHFPETQQSIFISAMTQGYYPIAIGQLGQIEARAFSPSGADTGNVTVSVQFLNVPVPPCVWSANGVPV
jgi:hypothetical protein